MKKTEKHPGGRPKTLKKPVTKQYRIDAETQAALDRLVKKWDCNESEALRRALKEFVPS